MKKNCLLLLFLLFTFTAAAQNILVLNDEGEIVNVKIERGEQRSLVNTDTDNYGRLTFSPMFMQPSLTGKNINLSSDEDMFYGLGIGYLFGINITGHHAPLFLELGPEVNVLGKVREDYYHGDDLWVMMVSLNTPLNLSYKLRFSDKISLAPYVGLNFRLNLAYMGYLDDESYDFFDKDEYGSVPERFQLGLNVGVGAYFNHFYVGLRYNPEITPYFDVDGYELKTENLYLTLGIKF